MLSNQFDSYGLRFFSSNVLGTNKNPALFNLQASKGRDFQLIQYRNILNLASKFSLKANPSHFLVKEIVRRTLQQTNIFHQGGCVLWMINFKSSRRNPLNFRKFFKLVDEIVDGKKKLTLSYV